MAKRFKLTANGKVLCRRAGKRHLLQGKGAQRRRSLGKVMVVGPTDAHRVKQNLPFGL